MSAAGSELVFIESRPLESKDKIEVLGTDQSAFSSAPTPSQPILGAEERLTNRRSLRSPEGGSHGMTRRKSRKALGANGPQLKCSLAWRNVSFSVGTKQIIQDSMGVVRPGELLTIMGPSGCGKTTLLSILARRTKEYGRSARLDGEVLFNGKPVSSRSRRDLVSLVPQDAALFGDFTVQETMEFQARLYFGWRNFGWKQLAEKISSTLISLGLDGCRYVKVGSLFTKGLSGGQKRRLSIAVEILSSPSILLLDEPTTGLDSATALGILLKMQQLAGLGHSVVATIHQPSSQMWAAMTNVAVMSQGQTVYSGPAVKCSEYFNRFGLACPKRFNPCEFFLGVVTSDFDVPVFKHTYTIQELSKMYLESETCKALVEALENEIKFADPEVEVRRSFTSNIVSTWTSGRGAKQVSLFSQFITLTWRNIINYRANLGIFVIRVLAFSALGIVSGLVFLDAGNISGDPGVMAVVSALLSTLVFFSFMSMAVIPFVIEDRLVFQRELRNGMYQKVPLVLSLVLIALVTSGIISIIASVITVYMCQVSLNVGLHFLITWAVLFYAEIIVFTVGAVFRHYILGIAVATSWFAVGLITAGVFVQIPSVTWVLRWQAFLNPVFWSVKAMYSEEWPQDLIIPEGLLFPNGQAVWDYFQVGFLDVAGFWPNYGCLVALVAGYVLIFITAVSALW